MVHTTQASTSGPEVKQGKTVRTFKHWKGTCECGAPLYSTMVSWDTPTGGRGGSSHEWCDKCGWNKEDGDDATKAEQVYFR